MLKSEIFLQLFIISLTAATFSLLAIKLYPSELFAEHTVQKASAAWPSIQKKVTQRKEELLPPKSIGIKSIGISLMVAPGAIEDNTWTLFLDKASWLVTSKTPGKGNVIIYAHNRPGLFGDLKKVTIGAEIQIDDGKHIHDYVVSEKRKIVPSDVNGVLSDKNQLTLYTCDGVFDQRRLVVIALPK